jgi:hypothetical protein
MFKEEATTTTTADMHREKNLIFIKMLVTSQGLYLIHFMTSRDRFLN